METMKKVLVVDDDRFTRGIVSTTLETFGYEVIEASDGVQAWEILQGPDAPRLVILDWTMPGMDGIEVCKAVRTHQTVQPPYLIVLTSKGRQEDMLEALNAGADEFLIKPVEPPELQARIEVGRRVVSLQQSMMEKMQELQEAVNNIKALQGIVPICSYCKKIRNDQQYWQRVEEYVSNYVGTVFSHGICPDCWEKHVVPEMEELNRQSENENGQG